MYNYRPDPNTVILQQIFLVFPKLNISVKNITVSPKYIVPIRVHYIGITRVIIGVSGKIKKKQNGKTLTAGGEGVARSSCSSLSREKRFCPKH